MVGIVWDELYLWHHTGGGAGPLARSEKLIEPGDFGEEGPHPRRRLRNLIDVTGLRNELEWVVPRQATEEELSRVHTPEYVAAIRAASASGGGDAGGGTPFGTRGFEIAALAVGGCLRAVESVLQGSLGQAYALVKPPGHHALSHSGDGHCIFNNVAAAAAHARAEYDIAKVTILDWDVHWGNGTQQIFWCDPAVQVISIHQADWYPRGGGEATEVGAGPGTGANINVPLPPGSGTGAYQLAFERVVLPAIRAHRPELILISCGYDAGANDPSGRMLLTSEDFRWMSQSILTAAHQLCDGRVVFCHEGGYSPTYVPFCGLAVLEQLCGVTEPIRDPFLARYQGVGYSELQPQQLEAIEQVVAAHRETGGDPNALWIS